MDKLPVMTVLLSPQQHCIQTSKDSRDYAFQTIESQVPTSFTIHLGVLYHEGKFKQFR